MGASIKTGGSGGGRRRRGRSHAPMSEINVTPFVDVMLVLLIIFMVTAPLLTAGVPIDLPEGKGQTIDQPKKEILLINIAKNGEIFFGQEDKTPLPIDALLGKLQAIADARGSKDDTIFVQGDTAAQHGFFTQVLDRIQQAGFRKVSVVLRSVEGKKG